MGCVNTRWIKLTRLHVKRCALVLSVLSNRPTLSKIHSLLLTVIFY